MGGASGQRYVTLRGAEQSVTKGVGGGGGGAKNRDFGVT